MAHPAQRIIVSVFADRTAAGEAIKALKQAGFHDEQLGFATRHEAFGEAHKTETGPNAVLRGIVGGIIGAVDTLLVATIGPADASGILSTALPVTEETIDRLPFPGSHRRQETQQEPPEDNSTAPDAQQAEQAHDHDERSSIIAGGTTGGILGGVAGAAAALLVPGIGPAVAGGVLVAALGSAAIGSIAGGFLGAFTRLGVPGEQARYYEREFKAGRTIVTVKAADQQQKAIEILRQHGAQHVQAH